MLINRLKTATLDLLFPRICAVCGVGGSFLCTNCQSRLVPAAPPRCHLCWGVTPSDPCIDCAHSPLDGARAVYVFDGGARELVHQLKYRSLHSLAEPIGELMAGYLLEHPIPAETVVPVPLHTWRRRSRGFNQSELLARVVSEHLGLQLDTRSLERHRSTPQQTRASERSERERNLQGAFRCRGDHAGQRLLLIDDVQTTGATLRECARTLKASGATSVWALSFTHVD